jgi:hypothetical protein
MLLTKLDITIALPHHQTTLIHLVFKKHAMCPSTSFNITSIFSQMRHYTCPSMSSSSILEYQLALFTS